MISIKFGSQPMPEVEPPKTPNEPIISASEAKRIAQKVIDENSEKMLKRISDIIRLAAKDGKMYIDDVDYNNLEIKSDTILKLESLGYKVSLLMDGIYACYRISWK